MKTTPTREAQMSSHIVGCLCARCTRVRQLAFALENPKPYNQTLRDMAKARGVTKAIARAAVEAGGIITFESGAQIFNGSVEPITVTIGLPELDPVWLAARDKEVDKEVETIMADQDRVCKRCGEKKPNTFAAFGKRWYKTKHHYVPKDVCKVCESRAKSASWRHRKEVLGD